MLPTFSVAVGISLFDKLLLTLKSVFKYAGFMPIYVRHIYRHLFLHVYQLGRWESCVLDAYWRCMWHLMMTISPPVRGQHSWNTSRPGKGYNSDTKEAMYTCGSSLASVNFVWQSGLLMTLHPFVLEILPPLLHNSFLWPFDWTFISLNFRGWKHWRVMPFPSTHDNLMTNLSSRNVLLTQSMDKLTS